MRKQAMYTTRFLATLALIVFFASPIAVTAGDIGVGTTLPALAISKQGEIQLENDSISYQPWSSETYAGQTHVIQYVPATMKGSKIFEPFTDSIQKNLEGEKVTVVTIINLDKAMWGTSGLVSSELKKNKRKHPEAVIVVDKNGIGSDTWSLGKASTALFIIDAKGSIAFSANAALSEPQLDASIELLKALLSPSPIQQDTIQ